MKKMILSLLLGISTFQLCAESKIIIGAKQSTFKRVVTSKPAKVIYGLLGIGIIGGASFLIVRRLRSSRLKIAKNNFESHIYKSYSEIAA